MLNTKELTEDPSRTSAFRPVTPVTKSPKGQIRGLDKKRDSGYGSDFSPASVKSVQRKFTFGDDTNADGDILDEFSGMDLHAIDDEDVFNETFEFGFSAIQELEEGDDTDKEVEELLTDSPHHSMSDPIDICRPPAPLPTPESVDGAGHNSNTGLDNNIGSAFYHTQWNSRDRAKSFRPFVSRSIGTQTPSPQCQVIRGALLEDRIAEVKGHVARNHLNLRLMATSDVQTFRRLPDVIPIHRDRSISLPDVEAFRRREQEQHIGRELRRISDHFNTEYRRRRGDEASSFPLRGYWNSLRRIVSSSSLFQTWTQPEDR